MKDKILIVDDSTENIKVLGNILRESGYEIGFAFDGRQAIEVLNANNDFVLILMDIKMPVLNGLDACKMIKQSPATNDIPIIFLTAKNEQEDILEGFNAGGADYITKPFHSRELLSRVSTHIQLKKRTDELTNTANDLKLLNATKDKFFSIISHDLRSPIAVLFTIQKMMNTEIENIGNKNLAELSSHMKLALDGAYKLLENLLKWSQSQIGHIKYNPNEIFLDAFIDNIVTILKPSATQKEITIEHEIDPGMFVNTDCNLLDTILRNLISNAIKYTNHGGKIDIYVSQNAQETLFKIKDNGVGIPEYMLNKLFKIENSLKSNPGTEGEVGSGLGLILCQELTEKINGKIWVESQENVGSTFFVAIPGN